MTQSIYLENRYLNSPDHIGSAREKLTGGGIHKLVRQGKHRDITKRLQGEIEENFWNILLLCDIHAAIQ